MTMSGGRKTPIWIGGSVLLILAAVVLIRIFHSPEYGGDGASFRSWDSAGVEIVESLRPAWGEGEGWRVSAEATLRIGVVDGDAAYQFNQIAGVGRLADGTVVVGDGGAQEVRFFGSDGRHLRSVGRSGEGPGEFLGLSVVGVGPSGQVWAYDFSLRRITWFSPDGEEAGLTSLAMEPPVLTAVGALPDGTFLLKQLWGAVQVSEASVSGLRRDPVAWVRFDDGGALIDSLGSYPGREVYLYDENGRGVMSTPPFARNSVGTIRGERVVVGDQESFELGEYDTQGALLRVIRIPDRVEDVGPAELEAYIQGRLATYPPERHPSIRQSLEEMPAPNTLPAYGGMISDSRGNLWVGAWAMFPEVAPFWTLFDEDGRWLGVVEVPPNFFPMDIGEDWVLGVERDEMDVEYVTLYPLIKG
jgi:hypothetical protein